MGLGASFSRIWALCLPMILVTTTDFWEVEEGLGLETAWEALISLLLSIMSEWLLDKSASQMGLGRKIW